MGVCKMIILVESSYPGTKADEAATVWLDFLKNNPLPEYVKIIDLYAFAGGEGIRVLLFFDVGKGKEEEGIKEIANGAVNSLRSIEGYKAEVHVVYNMAEALGFLGMKPPAA
jgi:hypothetical protein